MIADSTALFHWRKIDQCLRAIEITLPSGLIAEFSGGNRAALANQNTSPTRKRVVHPRVITA